MDIYWISLVSYLVISFTGVLWREWSKSFPTPIVRSGWILDRVYSDNEDQKEVHHD